MPVAIKLSRKFYDQLGEDIANELVEIINVVDDRYRSDIHEVNERNFARFEAHLDQRISELRAELLGEIGELRSEFHGESGELRSELHGEIGKLRADLAEHAARLESLLYREIRSQTRWVMGILMVQTTAIIGFMVAILQTR